MKRLLLPDLFLAGIHIGNVAGEPVLELDSQLCFERLGIARAHSANDVEPICVWPFEPRCCSIEQRLGGDRHPDVRHAPASQLGSVKAGRSDADHGEGMAVDLIAGADNRRIRAVLILQM